jgi:hypothetical protein
MRIDAKYEKTDNYMFHYQKMSVNTIFNIQ